MSEQWLSIIEYARKFSVSDMTVRRRIRTGRLKATLREGKYYIPIDDISVSSESIQTPSHSVSPLINKPIKYPEKFSEIESSTPIKSEHLQTPLLAQNSLRDVNELVATNKVLIEECRKLKDQVKPLSLHEANTYQETVARLEAQLENKGMVIQQLHQKVADFKLLVKMLETKMSGNHSSTHL